MKRIIAILLLAATALCFASCENKDEFHYDLIAEYDTKGGKHYYATHEGIEVEDYGTRYGRTLYDVEKVDGALHYFYAYDGEAENMKGETDMRNYMEYLDETFGYSETYTKKTGMFSYEMADGKFIQIMKYQMSDSRGMMLLVRVPSEVTADSSSDINFEYVPADSGSGIIPGK